MKSLRYRQANSYQTPRTLSTAAPTKKRDVNESDQSTIEDKRACYGSGREGPSSTIEWTTAVA